MLQDSVKLYIDRLNCEKRRVCTPLLYCIIHDVKKKSMKNVIYSGRNLFEFTSLFQVHKIGRPENYLF